MENVFWERFSFECQKRGKKPNQIREEIGISSGIITKWKQGTHPTTEMVHKVAEYFGVSAAYLLGIEETIAIKQEELLAGLDNPALADQIKEIIKCYVACDGLGQAEIMYVVKREFRRCEEERKNEAERAVAELKSS